MDLPAKHALLVSLTTALSGGVFLTIAARWLKLPAIILLLAGGVAVGPEGFGLVQPSSLEGVLPVIISLAVALILFEGGLTLDLRAFARGSQVITRLLSAGVLVTWLGTAVCVWAIFRTTPALAVLAGSLVIVTGPTVIGPLLKRIKVQPRLHAILHWEGVAIDPIGAFLAVLCFEWLAGGSGEQAIAKFAGRIVSGVGLGVLGGCAIAWVFKKRIVPLNLLNAFVLAAATLVYGVTECVISEAGLLSVTVAGLVVGWFRPVELKHIQEFKAEITDLLIGMLFLLLAPRLRFEQFAEFGAQGAALVGCVIFLVRPLNIWVSTRGSGLSVREKLFLSWVAPRGIVAASVASLFAMALTGKDVGVDARFLESFVYSVIVSTVLLQGFTAGPLAKALGLQRPAPEGWLLVSAGAFARRIARFLREETGREVLLLDTNARLAAETTAAGLPALCENALNTDLAEERIEFQKLGYLLALTDNSDLNELLCNRWGGVLGQEHVHRWSAARLQTAAPGGERQIVFRGISRPSVIGSEIASGEAWMETVVVGDTPPVLGGQPLLVAREGRVTPLARFAEFGPVRAGDRILVLRRPPGFLARSVEMALDLHVGSLEELYDRLADAAVACRPAVSREETRRELSAPGSNALPATLGHGVAIPHLYSSGVDRRLAILVRLPDCLPIASEAGDGAEADEPLRLVFFVLSPAGDPEGHLAALAEIARFCADAENRKRLFAMPTPEEALALLRAG